MAELGNVSRFPTTSRSLDKTHSANTNNSHSLSRAATVLFERREQSYAAAKHRRCLSGRDGIRNRKDEVVVSTPVLRVAAVGFLACGPLAVVRVGRLHLTVVLRAGGARCTVASEASAGLSTHANAVADFDAVLHIFTHTHRAADNFVANNTGVRRRSPTT